jgi:cytochrome b subunit of formate dehydrogenase
MIVKQLAAAVLLAFLINNTVHAQSDVCLECHLDKEFTTERGGKTVSLYVDPGALRSSAHRELECVSCHSDVDEEDLPHSETPKPVLCGNCHDDIQLDFDYGVHGQALNRREAYAPTCKECHGSHDILPPSDPRSPTYKMNIPYLCGKCHREGAPVAKVYDISEHNILENYSQSIHGEGLFKKGLLVTATCTDCHGSHAILPHTHPKSSIAPRNIASTCTKCHIRIEEVHVKVIRGELWEKEPGAIPACTDCHLPHKVRKESMEPTLSDRSCLKCHKKEGLLKTALSLHVDKEELKQSVHRNIPCVKCHSDIDPRAERPCETAGRAECANCHAKIADEYYQSGHGEQFLKGNTDVPYCTTCHGDHNVKRHSDENSLTFRSSVPQLCGRCHRKEGKASTKGDLAELTAYSDYSTSVHGKGLVKKGLLPSAICTDCHNSHLILKHSDSRSSVYRKNIPATCASCHRGIYKKFIKSVHFSIDEKETQKKPVCTDCHSSHTISEVDKDKFMKQVTQQCGGCHKDLSETYLQTMHGKAYHLGYLKAAKCSDCHNPHGTLSINDPNSSVGLKNIVKTCRKCHEDATYKFTGYLTHATHHDKVKYPILYYTYWAMTLLLIGVFTFFGIHTLLWLPRSFRILFDRRRRKASLRGRYYIQRFTPGQRVTHLFVIISFMSLALTGMMLKFSGMAWARFIADLLGGVAVARTIHRTAAIITFGYFAYHLSSLIRLKRQRKTSLRRFIFGENSLMFNRNDMKDFFNTVRWFLGLGPRPQYGRWTYWEKFDYFAVFWGVAVIGTSGLMLWLPEFFTHILPGWLINVAMIIHSDEALLAVGFIFTVHFFNTHLRPEAFPMDTVIFTGSVPVEEYKHDRPRDYYELRRSGMLRKRMHKDPVSGKLERLARVFGFIFLSVGMILIGLIIFSVIFGYR